MFQNIIWLIFIVLPFAMLLYVIPMQGKSSLCSGAEKNVGCINAISLILDSSQTSIARNPPILQRVGYVAKGS